MAEDSERFACPHCQGELTDHIPRYRLNDESKKRREAVQAASDLQAQLTAAQEQAGQLEGLQTQLAALQGQSERWGHERSLMQAGVTSQEGLQVALTLYGAMPADTRPPTVADWLTSDSLPQAVRVYLPQASAAPSDQPAPSAAPAAAAPAAAPTGSPHAGVRTGAPLAAGRPSAAELARPETFASLAKAEGLTVEQYARKMLSAG